MQIDLTSAGAFTEYGFGTVYNWLVSGSASSCELKVDVVGGNASPGGSLTGAWLSLSVTRSYLLANPGDYCVLAMQIRNASTLAVLASASSITISVTL